MNLKRAIKLREQLLNLPGKFAYQSFGKVLVNNPNPDTTYDSYNYDFETVKKHLCTTSACVAGWCMLLNHEITETNLSYADSAAQKYLELDYNAMRFLFFPDTYYAIMFKFKTKDDAYGYHRYTLDDAIERLDHLINLEKAKST